MASFTYLIDGALVSCSTLVLLIWTSSRSVVVLLLVILSLFFSPLFCSPLFPIVLGIFFNVYSSILMQRVWTSYAFSLFPSQPMLNPCVFLALLLLLLLLLLLILIFCITFGNSLYF